MIWGRCFARLIGRSPSSTSFRTGLADASIQLVTRANVILGGTPPSHAESVGRLEAFRRSFLPARLFRPLRQNHRADAVGHLTFALRCGLPAARGRRLSWKAMERRTGDTGPVRGLRHRSYPPEMASWTVASRRAFRAATREREETADAASPYAFGFFGVLADRGGGIADLGSRIAPAQSSRAMSQPLGCRQGRRAGGLSGGGRPACAVVRHRLASRPAIARSFTTAPAGRDLAMQL